MSEAATRRPGRPRSAAADASALPAPKASSIHDTRKPFPVDMICGVREWSADAKSGVSGASFLSVEASRCAR